ncbi:glycosyltransferase [Desulfovibrio sp. OttesenSCG-928-F07]|nr:glycosyltransferase [Desulfovibrio sp. OttesenSCG-928-F07]
MTKLVLIGNPFFFNALNKHSYNVVHIDYTAGTFFNCNELQAKYNLTPNDVIVVADKSLPPALLGVENMPCLTVFYAVDTHIHSWYPYYAQAFDLCLVSLKDDLPKFLNGRLSNSQVRWFPPYYLGKPVSPDSPEAAVKNFDFLFVGRMNPKINPERVIYFEKLKEYLPSLHCVFGNYIKLNPQARLVFNHSIAADFNFRIPETLGTGACLLTPRIKHGLEELFTDGEDLFLFDQTNIEGTARLAKELLADEATRLKVARSGYNKVCAKHLACHRAQELATILQDWFTTGTAQKLINARLAAANKIHSTYLRLIYLLLAENMNEFPELRAAYLAAAKKND